MKILNKQLLTNSSYGASPPTHAGVAHYKQAITHDGLPFGYHPIESNHFQQIPTESSLRWTYQRLDERGQQHWRALSIFPNEFDNAAAAAVWGITTQQEASTLLKVLEAEELVVALPSLSQEQEFPRYMLSQSARIFASARLSGHEYEKALFHHAKHYKEVLQQGALLYEQGGKGLERGLALFEQEWANIQAGQLWSADYAAQNPKAAALCCEYRGAGGYMLLVSLDSEEWLAWQEAAVMATQYLHDYQNESEREPIERQGLTCDVAEDEKQGTDALSPEVQELHTKALKLDEEGAVYLEEGEIELAIERLHEQLAIVRRLDDEVWEGKVLYQLGKCHYLLNEIQVAIEFYGQSRRVMRKMAYLEGEAYTLLGLGRAYAELGELDYAIGFYESCLQVLYEGEHEVCEKTCVFEELGNAYELQGDLPSAITFYERLLACPSQPEGNELQSRVLGYLGKAYHKSGQVERAIDCYKQQVAIEQESGNPSVEVLRLLGHAYAEFGEYQLAIAYYQQQLSLVREDFAPQHMFQKADEEESTLWYLGLAYHKAGQIREAIECYEQQLMIARHLGKTDEEMYTYEYLGLAYQKIDQVKQAIDCHQQQLRIAHQGKDWSSKARALEYLGLIYAELDQFPQAIKYFEQQLAIVSMFESPQTEARTLAYLANAYDLQGDFSHARKLYQQALQLNRELEDKEEEGSNLWHLSLALSQQGKMERAINYAEASLAIHEQRGAPQASNIRQILKEWQQKGTFGTFMNAFKRTLRLNPL